MNLKSVKDYNNNVYIFGIMNCKIYIICHICIELAVIKQPVFHFYLKFFQFFTTFNKICFWYYSHGLLDTPKV